MRRLLALLLCAAGLSLFALPVSTAGSSGGGTTITVSGDTVDIHINLDIVLDGLTFHGRLLDGNPNDDADAIRAAAAGAVAIWNKAFGQYLAGCLTLHLDLALNIIPWSPGRQLNSVTNGGVTYPVPSAGRHVAVWLTFDQGERPTVYDPFSPGPLPPGDYTTPYTNQLPAEWDDVLLDPSAFAHELGHYMGLADDYVDVPDSGESVPLPGRDGTMMHDGGPIDQDLVDRLGDVLARADPNVPKCKVWEGPIHLDAAVTGEGTNDHGTGDGTVRVVEDKNGRLHGTVSVHRSTGCDQYPGTKTWNLRVTGEATRGKLVIKSLPSEIVRDRDEEPICGFPDGFIGDQGEAGSPVTPLVAQRTSKTAANGEGTILDVEAPGQSYEVRIRTTYSIKLDQHTH